MPTPLPIDEFQAPDANGSPPGDGTPHPELKPPGRRFEIQCSILDVGFFCSPYAPRQVRRWNGSFVRRDPG